MEWVLVAAVVVAMLVTLAIAGRQRLAVRAQQEQLRRLESKLDSALGQNPDATQYSGYSPYPNQQPPMAYGPDSGHGTDSRYGPDPRVDEVHRLVREGKKIQAIKVYRELTGVGLADAKAAVERIAG